METLLISERNWSVGAVVSQYKTDVLKQKDNEVDKRGGKVMSVMSSITFVVPPIHQYSTHIRVKLLQKPGGSFISSFLFSIIRSTLRCQGDS